MTFVTVGDPARTGGLVYFFKPECGRARGDAVVTHPRINLPDNNGRAARMHDVLILID